LESRAVVDWADDDEVSVNAEFVCGQAQQRINCRANQTDALIRRSANNERRSARIDVQRHDPKIRGHDSFLG